MPRVAHKFEFGSTSINGIGFTLDREEWISDEITPEQAQHFLSIPGYYAVGKPAQPNEEEPEYETSGEAGSEVKERKKPGPKPKAPAPVEPAPTISADAAAATGAEGETQ